MYICYKLLEKPHYCVPKLINFILKNIIKLIEETTLYIIIRVNRFCLN